jgi:hypothetical protein
MHLNLRTLAVAVLIATGLVESDTALAQSGPPIIAVFNVETKGVVLGAGVVENLSDYVATRLTESGRYQVVPRDQLKERLVEQKKACTRRASTSRARSTWAVNWRRRRRWRRAWRSWATSARSA